jgi:type IV pilus assembly protein PilF
MFRRTMLAGFLVAHGFGCAGPVSEADQQASRIHYDLGVATLERGDQRGALRELLTAEDKDPQNPQVHNALGLVFHRLNRSKDAVEHYEKALALKPTFSDAHNNFGVLLIDLGRYDEAIEHFKKALADILYATPWFAEGNLGWALYKKGDVDQARLRLRNAVAENPKFCRGYEWLARIGVDTGDATDTVASVKHFEKQCLADPTIAPNLGPDYVRQMQYYLGQGYLKQGDREAARKAFAQCAVVDAEGEFTQRCQQALRTLQ